MIIAEIEKFLKAINGFATMDRMDEKLIKRLGEVMWRSFKVGFVYEPYGSVRLKGWDGKSQLPLPRPELYGVFKQMNTAIPISSARFAQKTLKDFLDNLANMDCIQMHHPAGVLEASFPAKGKAMEIKFAGQGGDPTHKQLPYIVLMTMLLYSVKAVRKCKLDKCGGYVFVTDMRMVFCSKTCNKRYHDSTEKGKKARATRYKNQKKEEEKAE